MKKIYVFLLVLMVTSSIKAGDTLTLQRNFYRSGDKIVKQQVEFVNPGLSGEHVQWDFSQLKSINDEYPLIYFKKAKGDTAHIIGLEHHTRYRYELKNNILWMTGYDNKTTHMSFVKFEAQLRYPFKYGDSLYTTFCGTGKYCQKVDLAAVGETFVKVDASGMMITPSNDTLNHVIRVKRLRKYTETGMDSTSLLLESYSWYARGYRYPVFETIRSYVLRDSVMTDHFSTSFYHPIADLQELEEDPENELLRNEDSENIDSENENYFLNCTTYPNPVQNDLNIAYDLSKAARIGYRICDLSGRSIVSIPQQALSAGNQRQLFSMSNFPSGDYVLHIIVDDKVYLTTVIKR